MKFILLTVGKTDVPWVRSGLELYTSRLQHYVKFELKEIPELKGVSALSEEQSSSFSTSTVKSSGQWNSPPRCRNL